MVTKSTSGPGFTPMGILKSEDRWSPLFLRATIATVMWPHGAQLLAGLFGGPGFSNSMNYFTSGAQLPWIVGFLVILIQFFGSLFLLAGFLTRPMALGMFVVVVGMIFSGHTEHGFFMNWSGTQKGEGFEFHLLLLGMCAALIISGSGRFSADRIVSRKFNTRES